MVTDQPPRPSHRREASTGADGLPSVAALLGPLRSAWDTSPALIAVTWGPQHVLIYQNPTSARLLGARQLGLPLDVAFPELQGRPLGILDEVLTTGEPLEMPRRDVGLRDTSGGELQLEYVVAALGDPPHQGVVMTAVNASGEARAEQAAQRATLVARVADRMTAAADPDAALQALTAELVPRLTDLAAVYITLDTPPGSDDGSDDGSDPVAITIAPGLLEAAGPPPASSAREGSSPWDTALAAGQTVFIDVGADADPELVQDDASAEWLTKVQARNLAVVPLAVAGELAGALVLLSVGQRPPYGADDVPFLEIVAARAGTAVAHLRSYQQQHQTALNLQRALLPTAPPPLPGIEVAARYVAGSEDVEVGGDWWDVHHLGAGRVGIGVGDVSGRGVPAAMLMGQARAGMRAAAHADLPPVDVLTVLDAQVTDLVRVTDQAPPKMPPKFATAAYAVIEPFDQTLRVANAGHPPLLLRHIDGTVERVHAPPGAPLGLGLGGYEEIVVPLTPGALLVAFTDGLVESRTVGVEEGIDELAQVIGAADPRQSVEDLADTLLRQADGTDDTALVVLRLIPDGAEPGRLARTVARLEDVAATRRAVEELVGQHQPELVDGTVQVCAELLANALQHAGPPAQLRVLASAHRVVVEVADTSALRPSPRHANGTDESGRGLTIVASIAHDWGSRITRDGKSTWADLRV